MHDSRLAEAVQRVQVLLERAREVGIEEPTAMTLATADAHGRPSARIVLLKGLDERGFVFYTNSRSRKGQQLAVNPRAALCFHWQPLREEVLVEGRVEQVFGAEADAYWRTRPRQSQIGAWASEQSQPLQSRSALEARFTEVEARFQGMEVPRPPHWGGYRVVPDMIEFWCSRPGRLHDRERFSLVGDDWRHELINP